jgi:hypothetical protein
VPNSKNSVKCIHSKDIILVVKTNMDNRGQGGFNFALIAVVAIIGIVVVQTIKDSFQNTLNNGSAGTNSLVGLFGLLIAVGAVLGLLRLAF